MIDEAEDDAISLMNLLDVREDLYNPKKSWVIEMTWLSKLQKSKSQIQN